MWVYLYFNITTWHNKNSKNIQKLYNYKFNNFIKSRKLQALSKKKNKQKKNWKSIEHWNLGNELFSLQKHILKVKKIIMDSNPYKKYFVYKELLSHKGLRQNTSSKNHEILYSTL